MASLVIRPTIRTRIRELGELRPGGLFGDTRINEEINSSIKYLYEMVIDANPGYLENEDTISVVSGTASYALPADYYKTLGVDVERTDTTRINLQKYNFAERNKYSYFGNGGINREWTEYRIRGGNIVFVPTPGWSGNVYHLYIPTAPQFSDDVTGIDFINGWDDFSVYDCLFKMIGGTEESDADVWMRLREEAIQRIMRFATVRDVGEPDRIRDVEAEEADRVWPRFGAP